MLIGLMEDMFRAGMRPQIPPISTTNSMYIEMLAALNGIVIVCPSMILPIYGASATAMPAAAMEQIAVNPIDSSIYFTAICALSAPTRLLVAISFALLLVRARFRLM